MRLLVALLLAWSVQAAAQPARAEFEIRLAAAVFSSAYTFIASRALEPASVDQVALWAMNAVTTLDPRLSVVVEGPSIHLKQRGVSIYQRGVPQGATGEQWGPATAEIFSAAWDASEAVRRAGTQEVITAVFEEMLNHLDPYSRYLPPGAAEADRDRRSGDAGAGLTLARQGAGFVIQSVNGGGPAAGSGVSAGDRLLAVDDQPTQGQSLATVLGWITGLEGTDVSLTLRGRDGRVRVLEVERAVLPPETVFVQRTGDVLLIRLSAFSADTDQRLQQELERWLAGGPARIRGIVLDLRGNRGGRLQQAVAATNLLLSGGVIARTDGRNPASVHDFFAAAGDMSNGRPLVILVDGRSASAAEIMAAALADDGRAVVVGSATLGKGLVQTILTLPDGGELFVTWSRVLAPLGWPLQGLGVLPQVCTSTGAEALNQQLQSLGRGVSKQLGAIARHRAARPPLPAAAIVDLRTACPAADGRESDMVAARFLLSNPKAYAAALINATDLVDRSPGLTSAPGVSIVPNQLPRP